jgi:hypothetical protein
MKTIRIRLARWLARRDEQAARNQRRALRDHNRREETAAARLDRRARARRIYAAWHSSHPSHSSHPAPETHGVSLEGLRSVLSNLSFRRVA